MLNGIVEVFGPRCLGIDEADVLNPPFLKADMRAWSDGGNQPRLLSARVVGS